MLFGYPVAATAENWLHDCLCEIVLAVHDCIAAGRDLPKWPLIAPLAYQDRIKNRTGLKTRIAAYEKAAKNLGFDELVLIADAMTNQNRIAELLSNTSNCLAIGDLPKVVREPILALFGFGFDLLIEFGVRDRQYEFIHRELKYRICPFCGCEIFGSPKSRREALDHYLAESRYPFAASNLRNLAPMGNRCNSGYKLAKDVLHWDDGIRRPVFDPYQTQDLQVVLENSQVNTGLNGPLISNWIVEFSGDDERIETWDDVFSIRDRYKNDFLEDRSFYEYLAEFQAWQISTGTNLNVDAELLDALGRYEKYLSSLGYRDRTFLKVAVFRMLLSRCVNGCARILGVMRDLVGIPQPI